MRRNKPLPLIRLGEQKHDFIHLHDVVSALMFLSKQPTSLETYDVGTGHHYMIRDLAERLHCPLEHIEVRFFDVDDPHGNISRMEALGWKAREDVIEYVEQLREIK